MSKHLGLVLLPIISAFLGCSPAPKPATPGAGGLRSWSEGSSKTAILRFVADVTTEGSAHFVAPENRIAAFDNDGTLWTEQPIYVMIRFAADRMKALAPEHPEWRSKPAFVQVIDGDENAILKLAPADQFGVGVAVHSGMTTDQYVAGATEWLATHRHPRFQRPYTDLAYAPMLELMAYLRTQGFQIYSSTGAESDFVRLVNQKSFGIGPSHVLATVLKTKFSADSPPTLTALQIGRAHV